VGWAEVLLEARWPLHNGFVGAPRPGDLIDGARRSPWRESVDFKLVSKYAPVGDQPPAIEKLTVGIPASAKHQVLLGSRARAKRSPSPMSSPAVSAPRWSFRTTRPSRPRFTPSSRAFSPATPSNTSSAISTTTSPKPTSRRPTPTSKRIPRRTRTSNGCGFRR